MATSQFTCYYSSDAGAPILNGTVGTLINVLRACLVTGYGSKAGAGWTEPITGGTNVAAFKQGAGSGFFLYVNDNNTSSNPNMARVTGWENVTALDTPVGVGSGQFPLPAQSLADGHVNWTKSYSTDSVSRAWRVYADSRTVYFFVLHGYDSVSHFGGVFGDMYSLNSLDAHNCILIGTEQASSVYYARIVDLSTFGCVNYAHFAARSSGDMTNSHQFGKSCAYQAYMSLQDVNGGYMKGTMPCPNPNSNAIYICPIDIFENNTIRGRLRGLWTTPHQAGSFVNGQVIQGAGDLASKSLQAIYPVIDTSASTACTFFIETSNTVETN